MDSYNVSLDLANVHVVLLSNEVPVLILILIWSVLVFWLSCVFVSKPSVYFRIFIIQQKDYLLAERRIHLSQLLLRYSLVSHVHTYSLT